MADDAGGLSAFISRDDDFARTAQAFRRKLSRPAATNVELKFDGVDVYDLEPKTLSNLYHGMPVRLYGRYRKGGAAKVTLRADLAGSELLQHTIINLPANASEIPEIERMWAFHKMQRLLKDADRTGSRDAAIDEVVRLGEAYSIVSEYTSFLVLENDAEFQRWKLERRNALRIERDRKRQRQLDSQLASLRKAVPEDLGPAADAKPNAAAPSVQGPSVQGARPAPVPQPRSSPQSGGGGGGGALDPLTGGIALTLAARALWRRRQKRGEEN